MAAPLQYSCLENPHGQRSREGCSPRGLSRTRLSDLAQDSKRKESALLGMVVTQMNARFKTHFTVHLSYVRFAFYTSKKKERLKKGKATKTSLNRRNTRKFSAWFWSVFLYPREFGSYVSDATEARIPRQPRGPTRLPARSELHPQLPGLAAATSRAKTRSPLQALPGRSPLSFFTTNSRVGPDPPPFQTPRLQARGARFRRPF